MAEDAEAENGPQGPAHLLALTGASREKADAFLDLQMEEMRERNPYELSHMRLRRFSGWARAALEASLGLIALGVVGGLGVMVWRAAHSDGYVIESFAVPPDLAARGLTGEVVAGRLLDRLNVVTTPPPNSVAAAQALSTSASDDVKVEIPETGVSLGELYRFLRRWLGHETHVSGEVVRQDGNLSVAVRIDGKDGAVYQGPQADLDVQLQKAAEHVFDTAWPTRYAGWLMAQIPRREAEARAVYQRMIADPAASPRVLASAWNGLANMPSGSGDLRDAQLLYRRSREADATYALGYANGANNENSLSHPEAALALLPQALAVLEKDPDYYSPDALLSLRARLLTREAALRGDHAGALAASEPGQRASFQVTVSIMNAAVSRARLHDGAAAEWLAMQPQIASLPRTNPLALPGTGVQIEAALQHWTRVITLAAEADKLMAQPNYRDMTQTNYSATGRELMNAIQYRPWVALAKAKLGDIAAAERLIADTPADCNDCLRMHGLIASEAKQWSRADYWFARAVADAPSIPFAHEDWGRSLLARGKPDEAIAQFALATGKGPHFADAIEGWGEALMAKNQSHLALAKFAAAEKFTPNWGRLHLKWGEALTYTGNRAEAARHFARAAALDLTPSEKSELQKAPHV